LVVSEQWGWVCFIEKDVESLLSVVLKKHWSRVATNATMNIETLLPSKIVTEKMQGCAFVPNTIQSKVVSSSPPHISPPPPLPPHSLPL
jgi:hypothetical protein